MSEQPVPDLRERVRDWVAVIFRRRVVVAVSFLVLATLATCAAYLQPVYYEARVRLLVTRDRVDATVTPIQEGAVPNRSEVTEMELRSEAQILQSRDLLRGVVEACGLTPESTWPQRVLRPIRGEPALSPAMRLDRLVMDLSRRLRATVVERSSLIEVTYSSTTAAEAYCVLDRIAENYVEKHLTLQRPAGSLRFFQDAAAGYRRSLEAAEARLREFGQLVGTGAVELQTDLKVRRLGEAEALLQGTNAGIAELRERARTIEAQLASAPERRTTEMRTADNPQLMERLTSTLLDLELKHTALAARYEPAYLPLQDLEQQIEHTRAAIKAAAAAPLVDKTTDSDPTYDWLRAELTRTTAELAALGARAAATNRTVESYRGEIRDLSNRSIEHQDLERQLKAEEGSYLLYLRKQEEARIAQALDSQGITNVVVAEAPNVPGIPTSLRAPVWLGGMVCAALASLLLAFVVDFSDPSFRTPREVQQALDLPVFAAFPSGASRMSGPEGTH